MRVNNSACIVDMQQAQLGRVGGGAPRREMKIVLAWGDGLTSGKDSRTQRTEAERRNRSNPNTRTQGKQRRRRTATRVGEGGCVREERWVG